MILRAAWTLFVTAAPLVAQVVATGTSQADTAPIPGRLVGVYDDSTGTPLAGVEVVFVGTDFLTHTGSGLPRSNLGLGCPPLTVRLPPRAASCGS